MKPPAQTTSLLPYPHGFFGRDGGVSAPPFDSLNGSPGSGDTRSLVDENRDRVRRSLGATSLVTANQTHSAIALLVDAPFDYETRPEADGMVTTTKGLALAVLTADCVPILFSAPGVVGVAHAGWRGSLLGIIENTILTMEEAGAERSAICAAVGPSLRAPDFEVRADLVSAVKAKYPHADRFFAQRDEDHWTYDHIGFVRDRLMANGISEERIADVGGNTLAEPRRYFSYRHALSREQPRGCNLSAITLA